MKSTECAYVAIRTLNVGPQQVNRTLELSFPSELSTLGTKWMNSEQKFTLHLQAAQITSTISTGGTATDGSVLIGNTDVKYSPEEQTTMAPGKCLCGVRVNLHTLSECELLLVFNAIFFAQISLFSLCFFLLFLFSSSERAN